MYSNFNFVDADYVFNNYQYFSKVTYCLDLRTFEEQQQYRLMNTYNLNRKSLLFSEKVNAELISQNLAPEDSKIFERRKRMFTYIFLFEKKNAFVGNVKDFILKICKKNELFNILKPDLYPVEKSAFKTQLNEFIKKDEEEFRQTYNILQTGLNIFETLQNEKIQEVYLICDSAECFFNKYPFMNDNVKLYSGKFLIGKSIIILTF